MLKVFLSGALILALTTGTSFAGDAPAAARDAGAIVVDYDAVGMPPFDQSKQEDKAYIQQFMKDRNAAMEMRAEFAAELWKAAPNHPNAFDLVMTRWITLWQLEKRPVADEEIDAALRAHPDDKLTLDLKYAKAKLAAMDYNQPVDQSLPLVEQFVSAAPTDERAASLLISVADRMRDQPEKSLAILRRVVEVYPTAKSAQAAIGKIRQADGVGKPFELSFTDAVTGKPMSMADLHGKVVVVDFWATWCGPCVADMPHMKEIYAKYKDRGVEFIGISLDEPEDKGGLTKLKAFVAKEQIPWPQYYQGKGWQSEFSMSWGINSIPALFVVDQKGNLYSANARGKVAEIVEKLLAAPEKVGG